MNITLMKEFVCEDTETWKYGAILITEQQTNHESS